MEIHFLSETVSIQDGEETRDFEIAQLVRPGQLLLSDTDQDTGQGKISLKSPVRFLAGANCEIAEGGRSLLSTATGYPHLDLKDEEDEQTASVTVTPLISISEDGMKACLTLHPPVGDAPALLLEDLLRLLREAGVVYGIDHRSLEKTSQKVTAERRPVIQQVVARGMHPVDGLDAYLRMEIETGTLPGKIRGDGSIDFRERRMFVSVEEGQLIATKIKETAGIPGRTVLGQDISQKTGKDIVVRVTEDAIYNETSKTVRAAKAGVVSIVKDSIIKVSSKQTVSGDVDFSTGNIYSKNAIEVSGSVKSDFVIAVRGDVFIGGDVQSATISSHGNLVVRGGIVGSASTITIRGDADINFIENGTLHAGGNVIIRKSAYYSTIVADGNIVGDQKTKILGGMLICSGSLTVGDIGSGSAHPATITVGTDVKRYQHYQELHRKVIELQDDTAHWLYRYGAEAEKTTKMIDWEKELAKAQEELSQLNLIPGSPVNSASDDFTIDDDAEIIVYGWIFAGTRLRIGNCIRTITINQNKKKYAIDKIMNVIAESPLDHQA
ncbi:MAG: FapA family protein [Desulfocapsaceae bacterium]|nr:FapA family protein [Desulfocapsaceae bacterium]